VPTECLNLTARAERNPKVREIEGGRVERLFDREHQAQLDLGRVCSLDHAVDGVLRNFRDCRFFFVVSDHPPLLLRLRTSAVRLQESAAFRLRVVQVLDQRTRFHDRVARLTLDALRVAPVGTIVAANGVARGSRRLVSFRDELGLAVRTREIDRAAGRESSQVESPGRVGPNASGSQANNAGKTTGRTAHD
jgi:hypothetical protein